MIASVHVADLGFRSVRVLLRGTPRPRSVPGLRHAVVALGAPLSPSLVSAPQPGRVGLVAFWDDEGALDAFLDGHRTAREMAGGWHVRLEPVRMWGTWPGVPEGIPRPRTVEHDGPAVVLTLGRLRLGQSVRFLRTSARAQPAVIAAEGLTWGTGLARPPFVATCSLWDSARALAAYAYGQDEPAHTQAIQADRAKPFHQRSAFIRCRPLVSHGSLAGRNPLTESWLTPS